MMELMAGSPEIVKTLEGLFARYGYWTVAGGLLLENAGIPVPGETILLFASFLAYSKHELALPIVILVGVVAATLGDNIGYFLGYRFGRWLLDRYRGVFRLKPETIHNGEQLFARRGALAVYFARFIAGLRIIAGPLAGVLRMPWRRFVLFNFLGAVTWVTVIAVIGYVFGSEFETLVRVLGRTGWVLAGVTAGVLIFVRWWHSRRVGSR